mmetsp:Transcript_63806/g.183285  ORF Transcript_63806/g.183285 Transcript_63806/m.183285 type:complete len:234 (-) Transcript_63806:1717-2418(-)
MYSLRFDGSYLARTSLSLASAALSRLNFLEISISTSSGTVLPMKVPVSISRILDTSMPSGLRACSKSSHSFSMSPAKVTSRLPMRPSKRLRCLGSMWKWSNNSTMSGSGAVLSGSSVFFGAGWGARGTAMLPAMPPALLTDPIMAMVIMGFAPVVPMLPMPPMPPMPPIPSMPPPGGPPEEAKANPGRSVTITSVVSSMPAIEAALTKALVTTLAGSTTPAAMRSSKVFVAAL